MADRLSLLKQWLDELGYEGYSLEIASEDASFRRYFRLKQGGNSWIVMDAPPEKEPCDTFVSIADKLIGTGLSAPEIFYENHDAGFLVLTDFGDQSYLQALNRENASDLYREASSAIIKMQTHIDTSDLPCYDEKLLRQEMSLFKEWFIGELLEIKLTRTQLDDWNAAVDNLVQSALEQPQVFVHRDYHSRNLMKIDGANPGILDFQDAVKGPVTYDLVSLLRDCYIDWPASRVDDWALDFLDSAQMELLQGVAEQQFMRWFNLMGIQRHLKAIGIFSRLKLRDNKDKFLQDIPRTLNYVTIACRSEVGMTGLYNMINDLSLNLRVQEFIH